MFGRGLRRGLDDSLRVSATLVASTVDASDGTLLLRESLPENNSELEALRTQGNTVRYLAADGTVLGGFGLGWNSPPDRASLAAAQKAGPGFSDFTNSTEDKDYRVFTLALFDTGAVSGFVQVLHNYDSVNDTLERVLAALLAGGAVVTVGAGLAGYFLARRALEPIDVITRTARRISAQDLSARLNLSGADDEVGRLASTFDDMLERLDDSFKRERRFTTDASHELRTPLAAMEAILGVVRSEPRGTAEYEEALDDLAEETARLRALAEDLLQLARGAQSVPARACRWMSRRSSRTSWRLSALWPRRRSCKLECRVNTRLHVPGDSDSLIRVFYNLLDNAIKSPSVARSPSPPTPEPARRWWWRWSTPASASRRPSAQHLRTLLQGRPIALGPRHRPGLGSCPADH